MTPPFGNIGGRLYVVGGLKPRNTSISGSITIGDSTRAHTTLQTTSDGAYTVDLPPGPIQIEAHSPRFDGGDVPFHPEDAVTVSVHQHKTVDIYCQAKWETSDFCREARACRPGPRSHVG